MSEREDEELELTPDLLARLAKEGKRIRKEHPHRERRAQTLQKMGFGASQPSTKTDPAILPWKSPWVYLLIPAHATLSALFSLLGGEKGLLVALVFFFVLNPILCVLLPRFWLQVGISIIAGFALTCFVAKTQHWGGEFSGIGFIIVWLVQGFFFMVAIGIRAIIQQKGRQAKQRTTGHP